MLSQSRGDYEDRTCPCAGLGEPRWGHRGTLCRCCVWSSDACTCGLREGTAPCWGETWHGSNVLPNSGGACECEGGKEKRQCNVAEHHLLKPIKGAQEFLTLFLQLLLNCNYIKIKCPPPNTENSGMYVLPLLPAPKEYLRITSEQGRVGRNLRIQSNPWKQAQTHK